MKFVNARPSKLQNLGQEVLGAARHRNDTYDNPEHEAIERKKKSDLKDSKAQIEMLKKSTIEKMPSNASLLGKHLENYETRFFQIQNMLFFDAKVLSDAELRAWVYSQQKNELYHTYRRRFNRMLKNIRLVSYRIKSKEEAVLWVQPKKKSLDSFREMNGKTTAWSDDSLKMSKKTSSSVLNMARAVQFGNSVPDLERAYIVHNLNLGLNWLKDLLPEFDLNSLAYAFGARGNAKSVAYYQDASKLISVNRHNDGSLVHEIGHAIDYKLNKISDSMPYEIRSAYMIKIQNMPKNHKAYLSKRTEIFARLFERYIYELAKENGQNEFMLSINPDATEMPVLNDASKEYMKKCFQKLKGA